MAQLTIGLLGNGTLDNPYRPNTTEQKWKLISIDTINNQMTIETNGIVV